MAQSYILSSLLVLIISVAVSIIFSFTSYSTNNLAPWLLNCVSPRLINANPFATFIFGDSTADVGTNSYIPDNFIRATAPHYGCDFEDSRPNGRFSNRFITVDFISRLMGFDRSPPPYLYLSGLRSDFLKRKFRGVNFASSGSGLLNTTSDEYGIIVMSEQVNQFIRVRSYLTAWMGQSSIDYLLPKSIFLVSIGTNDLTDYILSNSTVPQEQFITSLMTAYESYIKVLYDLGARKFGIISVLPLGCNPAQRVFNETGGCLDAMNKLSLNFYLALDALLYNISSELQDFKYSLGNTYRMIMNVLENPARYNFTYVDIACCGSGKLNAEFFCIPTANLCTNRNDYAFFDGNHPTDVAAELAARALFSGPTPLVSPINFGELVADVNIHEK